MKTIKIFLASSEELQTEREKMADLVLHLNKLFKGRGLELDLEKWEYLDASMSGKRKQDEYNDVLHQCDICMVLFWRRFGSYTGEELEVAYKSNLAGGNPQKIYVFFKNPNGDDISQEVRDFIAEYEQRFGGHFFCKYQTVDTMKLEFLLQLENYQKELIGEQAIEVRNEHVYVDNEALVDLNNVPFAAANEGFQKMQADLKELMEEIASIQDELEKKQQRLEKKKAKMEKDPDDEDYKEEYEEVKEEVEKLIGKLQPKLNKYNKMKEDFEREQQNLFNTARRMSALRSQRITERMGRAIEAFEEGDAHRANIILNEAERDADQALADIRQAKKVGVLSIDELLLKTSTIMSDTKMPTGERIEQTYQLYQKAVTPAKEMDYDKEKYVDLLEKYGCFLADYAKYDEALAIHSELARLREEMLGKDHPRTAASYNNIGIVYFNLGDYDKALEYYKQAMDIRGRALGKEHPNTVQSYNDIAWTYHLLGKYKEALPWAEKAVASFPEHPEIIDTLATVYHGLDRYDEALEKFELCLKLKKEQGANEASIRETEEKIESLKQKLSETEER